MQDMEFYSRISTGDTLLNELDSCLCRVGDSMEHAEAGMALGFRIGRHQMHACVVTPHDHGLAMVHAYVPRKCVVEHIIDDKWRKRVVAVWAFPGVTDYKCQA